MPLNIYGLNKQNFSFFWLFKLIFYFYSSFRGYFCYHYTFKSINEYLVRFRYLTNNGFSKFKFHLSTLIQGDVCPMEHGWNGYLDPTGRSSICYLIPDPKVWGARSAVVLANLKDHINEFQPISMKKSSKKSLTIEDLVFNSTIKLCKKC